MVCGNLQLCVPRRLLLGIGIIQGRPRPGAVLQDSARRKVTSTRRETDDHQLLPPSAAGLLKKFRTGSLHHQHVCCYHGHHQHGGIKAGLLLTLQR